MEAAFSGNSVSRSSSLQAELEQLRQQLEQLLQERNIPLGIRCAMVNDRLVVVGHHGQDTVLEPLWALRSLKTLLQALPLTVTQRVRLYLRVMGGALPYARCYFTVTPTQTPALVGTVEDAASGDAEENMLRWSAWLECDTTDLVRWDDFGARYQGTLVHPNAWLGRRDRQRWSLGEGLDRYVAISSSMAVAGLALSGLMVSAPCVSGACPELETAQVLGQQSLQLMQQAQDTEDLRDAQMYLDGAMGVLDTIPGWSERSPEARQLSDTYQQQLVTLDQAIAAAELASSAEQQSQNPAQIIEHWGTIQLLWQQAVDSLNTIPTDSPLYPFAQRQIEDYQTRLAFARDQRSQEADGQRQLLLAKQEIRLAQVRHAKATSETEWQQTQVAWNTAIERLQVIDPGTQAGVEAQRLLMAYGDIPQELGDRLTAGILVTPSVPPSGQVTENTTASGQRIYQTPINWSDLSQDVPIPPPPPTLLQSGPTSP